MSRVGSERCSIDGCIAPVRVKSRGWCSMHYHRWQRHGDPLHIDRQANGTPTPRYQGVHARLRRVRGNASDYACVTCGEPAKQWACVRNKDQVEIYRGVQVKYSYEVDDYDPLCLSCHSLTDRGLTETCRSGRHSWTEQNIYFSPDGERACRPCRNGWT